MCVDEWCLLGVDSEPDSCDERKIMQYQTLHFNLNFKQETYNRVDLPYELYAC